MLIEKLSKEMSFGSYKVLDEIFVSLEYFYLMDEGLSMKSLISSEFLMDASKYKKVLLLKTIYIPPYQRQMGLTNFIIDILKKRAEREDVLLSIGPIMADEEGRSIISEMCKRKGYEPIMPYSYLIK